MDADRVGPQGWSRCGGEDTRVSIAMVTDGSGAVSSEYRGGIGVEGLVLVANNWVVRMSTLPQSTTGLRFGKCISGGIWAWQQRFGSCLRCWCESSKWCRKTKI